MKDRIATGGSLDYRFPVGQIALKLFHAHSRQGRMLTTGEAAHLIATFPQHSHNNPAKKAATAGNKRLHESLSFAHTASFSRNILALWRISTGKAGWKRIFRISFV